MRARILVVDDEPDMTELLTFNLRAHHYEVIVARTGLEALNQARRFLPDAVLLDLMIDGIDGYSVCEILRRQPSTALVAVVMVTALRGEKARLNGLAAGADDFVGKPFALDDLVRRMEVALQARHARLQALLNSMEQNSATHKLAGKHCRLNA